MAIPLDLLASPAAQRGGDVLFHRYCAICHGDRGDGHGLQSEGIDPKPRDLTSRDWRQSTSPRRVFFAIREGVHGTAMPSWKSLGETEAWELTAYVLSLAGRGGS